MFYLYIYRYRIQKETRCSGETPCDQQDANRVVQAQPMRERRDVRSTGIFSDVSLQMQRQLYRYNDHNHARRDV